MVTKPKPNIIIDTERVVNICYMRKSLETHARQGAKLLQEEIGGNFEQKIRNEAVIVFSIR